MKHICYKPKKVLQAIYGEYLGEVLHQVIVKRIELNKRLKMEERWWSFMIWTVNPEEPTLLLCNFSKP